MIRHFTLEYWMDDNLYVGRLKEIPSVFSQGESLGELEENIQDAYSMMMQDESLHSENIQTKELAIKAVI